MKLFNLLIMLVIILNIISCGTTDVFVKPGISLSRNSTITIIGPDDSSGTKGQLTHLLISRGFNIVSEKTAKTAIRYKDEIKGKNIINHEFSAEIYRIKEFNSIYACELNYRYVMDLFGPVFQNFSAKLIDLNTGEIVMTANFRGSKSINSVLKDLASQIANQVK